MFSNASFAEGFLSTIQNYFHTKGEKGRNRKMEIHEIVKVTQPVILDHLISHYGFNKRPKSGEMYLSGVNLAREMVTDCEGRYLKY